MKLKKFLSFVLCIATIFSLYGCTKSQQKSSKLEHNSKPLKVVTTSETYVSLFNKFTKETGTDVEFISMSSGEVLSKVKAEGENTMADLWFGGGIDAFMQAKEDNLLEQVNFDESKKLAPEFKDSENYWFSKGLTVVGFIVNNDILQEKNLDVPKSWNDLTKSIYKNEILMSNPAISGTNYAVVNALLQHKGDEDGWKYFKELNNNIDYYSKRGKDPNVKTVAGEVGIGITYIDKDITKLEDEHNVTIVYPTDGMPYVPEGVAVFKNSSNVEEAKKFVEWIYKDENLRMLADLDKKNTVKLIKPDIEGIELSFDSSKLIKEDLSLFGKNRKSILDKWNIITENKTSSNE